MKKTRAFLALEIPERVKAELFRRRRSLVDELPKARWVRPEGQHVTLKFLGEVEDGILGRLVVDLRRDLLGLGAVEIGLGGCGFFPNESRPRVAWVGGRAVGVEPIVEAVERCSLVHGFAREGRPWSLHLTQARMRSPWPRWAVERFLQWGAGLIFDPIECAEVILYASDLSPGGAVYTAVERMAIS